LACVAVPAGGDLQACLVYHHLRDWIEAHLTIVSGAQPVSRWIERCDRVADQEVGSRQRRKFPLPRLRGGEYAGR
jgi:hypothetical protein